MTESPGEYSRLRQTGVEGISKNLLVLTDGRSIELEVWQCLVSPQSACRNPRPVIILTSDGAASQAAQHGDLPDVRERISDRALKQSFLSSGEWYAGIESLVKGSQSGKKASRSLLPREGRRVVPSFVPVGEGKRPVEQVTDVRQDLSGSASCLTRAKVGKFRGRAS